MKADKLIIPVDFVIFDVDDEVDIPLILGHPFLNMMGTLIDVKGGTITLRMGEEEVVFTLSDILKHTLDHDDKFYFVDETDIIIFDCVQEILSLNLLDEYLKELDNEECQEKVFTLPPVQRVTMEKNPSLTRKKKKRLKKM